MSKRCLIVDNTNFFIRSYIVDPSMNRKGELIGGLMGTLKSLQKIVRETLPDKIVVVWDGENGSRRRKEKDKNYKDGRKPIKLNRFIHHLSDTEESQNRVWQMTRLSEYYSVMPIHQFIIDNVEADDIVSYVHSLEYFKDYQKVIVSSDKDFIQLLDKKTILYRPTQKEILNVNRVLKQHGIHPKNFAIARAMVGDKSDNIIGVSGVGLPTIAKRLSFLSEDKSYLLEDVFNFIEKLEEKDKIKIFRNILESKNKIKENYDLMQLHIPSFSIQDKLQIKEEIENNQPNFNKTSLLSMMLRDGCNEWGWDKLFSHFNKIIRDYK